MKVAGAVFRKKYIHENTDDDFVAYYKNRCICITTNHGHGKPDYEHLERYDITVTYKDGSYDVDTWQDLHTMRDAIIYALKGAMLIPSY